MLIDELRTVSFESLVKDGDGVMLEESKYKVRYDNIEDITNGFYAFLKGLGFNDKIISRSFGELFDEIWDD